MTFAPFTRLAAAAVLALGAALPAKAVELTVTHWGALMYGVPFAVAQEKGWFAEEGIDVTGFITSAGGGTTLRNALAAEIPYGEASLAAVVAAAGEGVPLTIVHAGVRSAGDVLWVTRKGEGLEGIEALKGRKIGFTSPKSVSEMLLIMSLDAAGVPLDETERLGLGGISAGLTALREGAVDAATILEPIWSRFQDEFDVVFAAADLLPPVTQTVGVVRTDWLAGNRETVEAIIRARQRGVAFIYENPAEAAEILARAYDLAPEIARSAVEATAALKYWSDGSFEYDAMDNMVKGLQLVGAHGEEGVNWAELVDESLLPAALQSADGPPAGASN